MSWSLPSVISPNPVSLVCIFIKIPKPGVSEYLELMKKARKKAHID